MSEVRLAAMLSYNTNMLRILPDSLRPTTPFQRIALYGVTSTLFIVNLISGYNNYQLWRSLGPGGLPYNFLGWTVQGLVGLLLPSDTIGTRVYSSALKSGEYGQQGLKSYLEDSALPRRAGSRPNVPGTVAPQRQVLWQRDQIAPKVMHARQDNILKDIAAANSSHLTIAPSRLEGRGTALWLREEALNKCPPGTTGHRGEIAHFHLNVHDVAGWSGEADGSGHCILSIVDAKEVVEKGWGERHRASGFGPLALGFTMLYAPRDEQELEMVEKIVTASVRYMVGGAVLK